jgi:inner membrane protein
VLLKPNIMNEKNEFQTKNSGKKFLESSTVKMVIIGVLNLILMIPMIYVSDLIQERKFRKKEVIREVNDNWGEQVKLIPPVLVIPYKIYSERNYYENNEKKTEKIYKGDDYLYVLPENLQVDIDMEAVPKHRGIFQTSVYKASSAIKGNFIRPDITAAGIDENDIKWNQSFVIFKTTNNKGIEDRIILNTPLKKTEFFLQDSSKEIDYKKFQTPVFNQNPFKNNNSLEFSMNYNVKGSRGFYIIPTAQTTQVQMKSNWTAPKFEGAFLPDNEDKILPDNKGFNAHWKIIDYQRPFKKIYNHKLPNMNDYAFGIHFLVTVDNYLKAERAEKYAYLVIFLTFLVFFIIQHIGKVSMHIFNYFLIGLALVIFYTLLISISEHTNFNFSYIISAFSTVLLISLYSKSILNNKKFSIYIFSILSMLYFYIFVIIQLENYALLVGSIGLFVILAGIMYSSRKIKW